MNLREALAHVLHPRTGFLVSCAFLALLYGFAASQFQWFPHDWLAPALTQTRLLAADPIAHRVHPVRANVVGAVAYGPDGAPRPISDEENRTSGVTLLTSYWLDRNDRPGARIVDARGDVLHHWDIDADAIWGELHERGPFTQLILGASDYPHGTWLLDNGDLLFNIEYLGLARVRADGELVWYLDRPTHHSVHRNERGNFWVCGARGITDVETAVGRFLGLIPPFVEDLVLEVSPDGEVLREISILELVFASPVLKPMLWTTGPETHRRTFDLLHINDVEELPSAIAGEYPMFEAGDLVVSIRALSAVVVFDPETLTIRWISVRDVVHQHDPDFVGDGWIAVFDNRTDDSPFGQFLGGSRLVLLQPHTGDQRTIFPRPGAPAPDPPFYTSLGGKLQKLDGGHWLLTEAIGGRVLEIDDRGRIVWEWAQQPFADGKGVCEVLEGTRYALTPEDVERWSDP